MNFVEAKDFFSKTLRRVSSLNSALALLEWDTLTIAPPKGADARAEVIGSLSSEAFLLETSDAYGEAVDVLSDNADELTVAEQRMVKVAQRDLSRKRKIPSDLYEAWATDRERSSTAWHHAKGKNDFASFQPHLQKMIDYNREFIRLWVLPGAPYDALLDEYEPGLHSKELDEVFAHVVNETRDMLGNIPNTPDPKMISVPVEKQKAIGEYLMEAIGFDAKAGNLYPTEHPFSSTIHEGDNRLTTKYIADNPESSIFSVLHEAGHGMYEQNIDPALAFTNLFTGTSMGIHESQSRFWENIVGRSLAFWEGHLGEVNRLSGGVLGGDASAFYRRVNAVKPSLIRIEADELTYNLHIIIRYELERMIFNEGVNAAELPALWNNKYQDYLGLTPPDDTRGVMQDVHWSGGMFGYFPSYSLGNLYGAQFAKAMEMQIGKVGDLARSGNGLGQILSYLKENIYRYGKLEEPAEILLRVTGRPLDPKCLTDYLRAKLGEIYGF